MLDPYFDEVSGRQVLMTSIALPLLENGKVIGVVGLDIGLDNLQQLSLAGRQELFDGQGQVSIVSPAGLLAGHSQDSAQLSKTLEQAFGDQAGELAGPIRAGQTVERLDHGLMRISRPFAPIPQAEAWQVLLELPEAVLQAPAVAQPAPGRTQPDRQPYQPAGWPGRRRAGPATGVADSPWRDPADPCRGRAPA